jgi:hypothetical protein
MKKERRPVTLSLEHPHLEVGRNKQLVLIMYFENTVQKYAREILLMLFPPIYRFVLS